MEKEKNILGYEKIGKLIRKFAVPCIISMVVNALYNIVDQIFIGWGVGYLGNGATNVVFPITVIALAFSLMFGDGSSAFLSIKLGEKKKDEAAKGVANGIIVSAIIAILLGVTTLLFLPILLNIFGCTDALKQYALNYGYIIGIGLPFMIIGTTLNSIIRADGNPKYAMTSMLTGAILNIILDPIFIFVFKMGVQGAAIATVLSQIITFILNVAYIKKFKTIKITKNEIKIDPKMSLKIAMLGVSSFITQMSIVVLISVQNNLLSKYGAESKFGAEIPITVLGIVMKISQILNSIILGIAVGSQPIIGFNYGAKNYDRVKDTLKLVLKLCVGVSTISFILFQTIPDKLIAIFGKGDASYVEFACMTFRIYLMLIICCGVQMPTSIFFQAIGKGVKSAIISLSRQILLLIPFMIILGKIFGLTGILIAGPVADGLSFVLATTLLVLEVKGLKSTSQDKVESEEIKNTTKLMPQSKHVIITISREYGSGGRYVGKLLAEKLGVKLYDKQIILEAAKQSGLSEEYVKENEQKISKITELNNGYYSGLSTADELYLAEKKVIEEIAQRESCVIVGRCADFILKDRNDVIKVFIYSSMEDKIKRAVKFYNLDEAKAEKEIEKIDKLRANHYSYYTDRQWKDFSNYDVCINSDKKGVEETAQLIAQMVK